MVRWFVVLMGAKGNASWFFGEKPKERDHLKDLGVDRIILLKWIMGGVSWFHLAQDGYKWRAVVNVVMSLRVP
jgi:hypothetical protein